MYPSGPISHERHFLPIFLEIETSLRAAELEEEEDDARISDDDDDDDDDDDENSVESMPNSPNRTNNHTTRSSTYDNKNNDDNDDNDQYEWTVPVKSLPTASELCANTNYQDTKDAATSNKRSLFGQFKMPPRRQTDDTVDLDKDEEDILRQIYRHDSLGAHVTARAGRLSSAFARSLSACMQNLALEASQHDGGMGDDDSVEYVSSHDDDSHNFKVGECYEMNVFVDHRTTRTRIVDNNDSMGSVTTELTSNAKKKASRRNSATSTDDMNDILLKALEKSSSNGCKLSDADVVPTEVEVGKIARRMDRRFSRRRSFTNATAA
eukprot:CAMPEP_0181037394 /NCGR_PEP_ID=MMETSP1070-20121207/9376_1 /TAXON_ID=265543 /ORGANISM="Minutocellus polymorphus, Strain NH13" /LENGTH=322 /DNA_ID=CAMNT_0023115103 /DNA_START=90 /DNA_END=1058 /DNA_ORIENTATION=+